MNDSQDAMNAAYLRSLVDGGWRMDFDSYQTKQMPLILIDVDGDRFELKFYNTASRIFVETTPQKLPSRGLSHKGPWNWRYMEWESQCVWWNDSCALSTVSNE